MISKVLRFQSEHQAAEGLRKLELSGIPKENLRVLVINLDHSRLLHSETEIHIDLLSEIGDANRDTEYKGGVDQDHLYTPFFTPQTTVPIPAVGVPGISINEHSEQGINSLLAYGISEDNAERCLQALRAGQCLVCITEREDESSIFDNLELSFGQGHREEYMPETGAIEVFEN